MRILPSNWQGLYPTVIIVLVHQKQTVWDTSETSFDLPSFQAASHDHHHHMRRSHNASEPVSTTYDLESYADQDPRSATFEVELGCVCDSPASPRKSCREGKADIESEGQECGVAGPEVQ